MDNSKIQKLVDGLKETEPPLFGIDAELVFIGCVEVIAEFLDMRYGDLSEMINQSTAKPYHDSER